MNAVSKAILLAVATFGLPACAVLGPSHDVIVYAPTLSASSAPPSPRILSRLVQVTEPQALAPLLGTQLWVSPHPGQFSVYRGARWADAPPVLLQTLLVQGLHEAGIVGADKGSGVLRADYLLESDLRAFQAEYRGGAAPLVVLRLDARLIHISGRRIIATRTFVSEEPSDAPAIPVVGAAFARATDRLVREVSTWTHRTVEADPGPSP